MGGFMVEAVICVCGFLLLGGITKVCCTDKRYSEEYYKYLRNNGGKKNMYDDIKTEYYKYL